MPSGFELLSLLVRYRIDAIAIVLAMIAVGGICWLQLRRRGATRDFSGRTCVMAVAVVLVGTLLVEWTLPFLDYPVSATRSIVLMTRALVLGSAAVVAATWLIAAARIALLRTELRVHAEAGRQLEQAKAAADEAGRAKSDFLAVMSHEIRTPLNAVMGFAGLLTETNLDHAQRGYVNTITSEGARLRALISDILDFTKIEQGQLVLERLPFSPAQTAQEVLRLLSSRATEKRVDLRFEAHLAGPLQLAGDPLRFRQILVNLIDNAIKFTPRGSVTVYMAWRPPEDTATPDGQLSIRICDTGIGIPAEKLPTIFQMFMQADTSTSRRYGGTGLGLAISQKLVGMMGGEIVVDSTQGEGSTFSFVLTLPPFSPTENSSQLAAEPVIKRERPPRILVVDDMETNRFLLEVFLRRQGFDPQLAAGGEEAVRLALENQYDAILMDLQMPGIDGYTATKRIRSAESAGRRTPIIALTASFAKGTREKCLEAGMDEHLTKPLDLRRFSALLNTLISPAAESVRLAS
jgi:hypothetical protein